MSAKGKVIIGAVLLVVALLLALLSMQANSQVRAAQGQATGTSAADEAAGDAGLSGAQQRLAEQAKGRRNMLFGVTGLAALGGIGFIAVGSVVGKKEMAPAGVAG